MKLNMWMIANRLSALEPEMHIPEDAPANLLSARRAYATQCVYVYQKGKDVICDGGIRGGYIVFRNMECDQVFEMVQFTFDFYQEWQELVLDAAERLDYDRIIDKSWVVFHNPMILLDASNNVLAMSEQYGEDDVNNDWRYLCQNGYSSVQVIQYLIEEGRKNQYYLSEEARFYHLPGEEIAATEISAAIYCRGEACGRINVIERDRKLNPGDLYLVNYLVRYLSIILGKINQHDGQRCILAPTFTKMLLGQPFSEIEFQCWRQKTDWNDGDKMWVGVYQFTEISKANVHIVNSICHLLQSNIKMCSAVQIEQRVVFNFKEQFNNKEEIMGVISDIRRRFQLKVGISLVVQDVRNLRFQYQQALAALRYGNLFEPEQDIYHFYQYAMDYIVETKSLEEAVEACHPDIRKLWLLDKKGDGEKIHTLQVYLDNERSPINAAKELYLHKNTLVYRMKKISEVIEDDLDEIYTRDYIKLSIRVLRLYDRIHKNNI